MSGHLRLYFASLLLVGGFSATPASSNPLTDFFNTATSQPTVTTPPPQAECAPRPGTSTSGGQHWVYRTDGRRRCWFLAEGIATVKKPIRAPAAKDRSASFDENRTTQTTRSVIVDARAELLRSAPPEQSQTPVTEMQVADATSDLGTGATLMSAAPVGDIPRNQLKREHSVPDQVNVGQFLAAAPADPSQDMPLGPRTAEGHDEARSWTGWLGGLLMTLGGLSLLSSSHTLRHAVRLRH
ncbi:MULTISPECIES: hypothetical protein [unclassified Bradyrhizobium]|uniref:hypothetical protein n=1 Tax=unclassified Bradyrhizobium TaxID=2631580 RepID=UPI000D65D0DF|nr:MULTISPECIES: hypothetical protein [unclassified Bradyrhizobium]MCA1430459.1 hypothetical protein [Bradyrhizobium sp. NBAIM16]MCA1507454.1 hypothetical protein [Bradyrhizobium sp. NBAIM02]MCA1516156.1 hypothetical protein [Bradyrhizobium sp. NBAIM01]PWE81681.1 hypothetical protein XF30_11865 [Bradyrhizobium sp. SUTN9-2]